MDTDGPCASTTGTVGDAVGTNGGSIGICSDSKALQTDHVFWALYPRATPNIMGTVVGGMKGLRTVELASMAQMIEEHMTGNPNFPDAAPLVAQVVAARQDLMVAITDAMDGGRSAHFIQRERKAALKNALTMLLNHVLSVALGDLNKLVSSGFPQRRPPLRIGALATPQKMVARHGDHPGQVHVHWAPVYGARLYRLEMNDGDPDQQEGWHTVAEVTHAYYTMESLASLRYFWFRVVAIGTAGESPYSDPARSVAL